MRRMNFIIKRMYTLFTRCIALACYIHHEEFLFVMTFKPISPFLTKALTIFLTSFKTPQFFAATLQ